MTLIIRKSELVVKIRVYNLLLFGHQIRWSKDNVDLSTEGRYRVEIGERHAFLHVSKADKCDDGRYRLTLDNDLGSDTAVFNVKINGEYSHQFTCK